LFWIQRFEWMTVILSAFLILKKRNYLYELSNVRINKQMYFNLQKVFIFTVIHLESNLITRYS